jgi:hypothetical protein
LFPFVGAHHNISTKLSQPTFIIFFFFLCFWGPGAGAPPPRFFSAYVQAVARVPEGTRRARRPSITAKAIETTSTLHAAIEIHIPM